MKIPLSWLQDYVDIKIPVGDLTNRLTLAGLEVGSVEQIGAGWERDKLFVGQIIEVRPHPDADRLCLAVVDYGAAAPLTVVTGAPNVKQFENGMPDHPLKIAFATVGAQLIDGHKDDGSLLRLKPSKIRGVRSEGMVCSEKELGLSDEHTGILYLPPDAPVGMPLMDYLGDWVLEFDIKGAFAHLLAVTGIARETAALLNQPFRRSVLETDQAHGVQLAQETPWLKLGIAAPDLCARYTAAIIRGVKVGPSPLWMQQRLQRAGMRPINNIVDITNYVMLELGQPLHAFDYARLRPCPGEDKPAIIVRRAAPDETITTLDGVHRDLDAEMLLITDGGGPVAIAGVMGGLESEVSEATADVLLESANFNFLNNRRTGQKLKLSSEAGTRFGKRVAPELTVRAAARAAWLMAELTGGQVEPLFCDMYPLPWQQPVIELPVEQVKRTLGIDLSPDDMMRILRALEFEVQAQGDLLRVGVPDHRLDIAIPADLIEEIGRVYGYDRFPHTLIGEAVPPQRRNVSLEGEERVRDLLTRCGLDEVITYSMVDIRDDARLGPQGMVIDETQYVKIRNPLTAERAHMRRQLLPSLLNTLRSNLRFVDRVTVFEIAHVYLPRPGQVLPNEPRRLGIVMSGPRQARAWQGDANRQPLDFYDLKGVADSLCAGLALPALTWARGNHPAYHPGRCAQLSLNDIILGYVGELHPTVRQAFDLPEQPVCALELNLDALLSGWGQAAQLEPLSMHPPVYEDLAVVVDEDVPACQVAETILQAGGSALRQVELFDVYRGERVGAGKKSLAYALTYQADDKTLTDDAVAKLRGRIIRQLEARLGAALRS